MTTQGFIGTVLFPATDNLFKNGLIMSFKLQLAKEVTISSRDNNVDTNLFASWPLFIIVHQWRSKMQVCLGKSLKKQLRTPHPAVH